MEFNKVSAIPGAGFANIMSCPGSAVEGVLYAVSMDELRMLDHFEGVPRHYRYQPVNVEAKNTGKTIPALTYVASCKKIRDGLKPTREYLEHLLAGAELLSEEYVRFLRAIHTVD